MTWLNFFEFPFFKLNLYFYSLPLCSHKNSNKNEQDCFSRDRHYKTCLNYLLILFAFPFFPIKPRSFLSLYEGLKIIIDNLHTVKFPKLFDTQLLQTLKIEPRSEKTGLRGFRPGLTQTGLYSHRRWPEA